jgi:hypothetical protein
MKNFLKNLISITFLIVSLFFCLPTTSFASDDVVVNLDPKTPTPYSPITVTLTSYSFDVNTTLITWSRNGKEILKGTGEKRLTVQMGSVGNQIPIHVHLVTADNQITDTDIVLTPESVDILYETPESYTPLFYEGRSLPSEGALVKFVAVPNISENGVQNPASSLSYFWYVNDEFKEDVSGAGKSSNNFNLDLFSNFTRIKVVVHSPRGATAEKFIDIYPHAIMPLFYTYDDIFGVNYTNLIDKRFEATKDFTLALEPFYLSLNKSATEDVSYSWAVDGLPVTPLGGRLLSMHPKENSYGSRILSISVENNKRQLQKANTTLNLIFDTRQ